MLSNKLQSKLIKLSKESYDLPNSHKKHFSFITDGNKIVSFGWNNGFKSHPLAKQYGHRFNCIHSELSAIKNFPYMPRLLCKYTFINVRLLADKTLGLAAPCSYCSRLLNDFEIYDVWYSTSNGFRQHL